MKSPMLNLVTTGCLLACYSVMDTAFLVQGHTIRGGTRQLKMSGNIISFDNSIDENTSNNSGERKMNVLDSTGNNFTGSFSPSVSPVSEAPSNMTSDEFTGSFSPTVSPVSEAPSNIPSDDFTVSFNPTVSPVSEAPSNMTCISTSPTEPTTTFYVMGDVPYNDKELAKLPQQLADIPSDAKFVVHVGDMNRPRYHRCKEHIFSSVSDILRKSAYPFFIIPGDNDYADCPKRDEAWLLWKKNFGSLDTNWNMSSPVTRQTERNENFAFFLDDVLFVGVHSDKGYIKSKKEIEVRAEDMRNWITDKVDEFRDCMTALVIFAHREIESKYLRLFDSVAEELRSLEIPSLFIHGNGHDWEKEKTYFKNTMLRVQVDRGGKAPPLKVTIRRDVLISIDKGRKAPPLKVAGRRDVLSSFEFDRRL